MSKYSDIERNLGFINSRLHKIERLLVGGIDVSFHVIDKHGCEHSIKAENWENVCNTNLIQFYDIDGLCVAMFDNPGVIKKVEVKEE